MIYYLATYPRSGNSQLQSFIVRNFCFLASQVKVQTTFVAPPDWDVQNQPRPDDWPPSTLWDERTATYRRFAPDDVPVGFDRDRRWRYYHSGVVPSPDTRERLAREPEPFFIKTHDLPFDRYFDGEHVIQIRRDPGAVMWSYFRYQMDFTLERNADHMFEAAPPTLERTIAGEVPFGDWSAYHDAWDAALPGLGERAMQIRFTDMGARTEETLQKIGAFIGHPIERADVEDFQSYNSRFAGKGLRGSDLAYEQFYTRAQLELLWDRHGVQARRNGFAEPQFDLAAADDQIARLTRIIETAWEWGGRFDRERRELARRFERLVAKRDAEISSQQSK